MFHLLGATKLKAILPYSVLVVIANVSTHDKGISVFVFTWNTHILKWTFQWVFLDGCHLLLWSVQSFVCRSQSKRRSQFTVNNWSNTSTSMDLKSLPGCNLTRHSIKLHKTQLAVFVGSWEAGEGSCIRLYKACLRTTPFRRVSLLKDVEETTGESIINTNIIFPIFVRIF